MTFAFLVGSRNFKRLFWVLEKFLFYMGRIVTSDWVSKSCATKKYRWLLRDSLPSLRILWSAVIKSTTVSIGHDCTSTSPARSSRYFYLQADIEVGVLRKVGVDTVLTRARFHFFARDSIGNSWEELAVSRYFGAGFPKGSERLLSSTKFSLISWQSSKSCYRSICTSSSPPFFVFGFCWFMHRVSPQLLTRISTSFGYWIFGVSSDVKYRILRWRRRRSRYEWCTGTRRQTRDNEWHII